jgi:hypothetical protein
MTFIEQACHARATELWQKRPNLNNWRARIFFQILRYCEVSAVRPTSSASIVLFRGVAAASAYVFRRNAPAILAWKTAIASEPKLLDRKMSEIRAKAQEELHLHQIVFARLFRLPSAERVR